LQASNPRLSAPVLLPIFDPSPKDHRFLRYAAFVRRQIRKIHDLCRFGELRSVLDKDLRSDTPLILDAESMNITPKLERYQ